MAPRRRLGRHPLITQINADGSKAQARKTSADYADYADGSEAQAKKVSADYAD
jgi:hypothetical protein